MKYIYVNLKRFDIMKSLGGVNDYQTDCSSDWATEIFIQLGKKISQFSPLEYEFVFYLPEAYLISAKKALGSMSNIKIGCQSVHSEDTFLNGNIGAYTTLRPASSMLTIGIHDTIIGHSEERKEKLDFLDTVSYNVEKNVEAIHADLQKKICVAQKADMNVLYCIGESFEARQNGSWKDIIKGQLKFDEGIDVSKLKIAYEPIWAIGPNRPVPDGETIQEVASYIHSIIGKNVPVLYGGGLKESNVEEISSLPDVSGGLVALTSFTEHIGFYPDQFINIVNKYNGSELDEEV